MSLDELRLFLPSNSEYPVQQLRMVLRQTEVLLGRSITSDEWESL